MTIYELEIPDRARDLMLRSAWPTSHPTPDDITNGQYQAVRLVVSAELRRIADVLHARWRETRESVRRPLDLSRAVVYLRDRADELDPDGMAW